MSEQVTRHSTHAASSDAIDQFLSEDSSSVHSFASGKAPLAPIQYYISTSLVTSSNITLADVITEDITLALIIQREEELAHKSGFK